MNLGLILLSIRQESACANTIVMCLAPMCN